MCWWAIEATRMENQRRRGKEVGHQDRMSKNPSQYMKFDTIRIRRTIKCIPVEYSL